MATARSSTTVRRGRIALTDAEAVSVPLWSAILLTLSVETYTVVSSCVLRFSAPLARIGFRALHLNVIFAVLLILNAVVLSLFAAACVKLSEADQALMTLVDDLNARGSIWSYGDTFSWQDDWLCVVIGAL